MNDLPADIETIRAFHRDIVATAQERLGRSLTLEEKRFVTRRGGFVALEMISDTVRTSPPNDIVQYLNSENPTEGAGRSRLLHWLAPILALLAGA